VQSKSPLFNNWIRSQYNERSPNTRVDIMQNAILKRPEDITGMEGYVPRIAEVAAVKRIVRYYDLRPFEIACSLCGKSHMDGRIVELEDAAISNIGHICGKKLKNYDEADRRFQESLGRPILLAKLKEGKLAIDALQLRADAVRNRLRVEEARLKRFEKLFPQLAHQLRRRALDNDARVYESQVRSNAEIADLIAANPFQNRESLQIKEVFQGTVEGFRFPGTDWTGSVGAYVLFDELIRFLDLDLAKLSIAHLSQWGAWYDQFEGRLAQLAMVAQDGNAFFSQKNLQLFVSLANSPDEKRRVRSISLGDFNPSIIQVRAVSDRRPLPKRIKAPSRVPTLSAKQLRRLTGNKKAR
jgi:hypothetical protein